MAHVSGVDSRRPSVTVAAVASEARAGTVQISPSPPTFSLPPWKVAPRALLPSLCVRRPEAPGRRGDNHTGEEGAAERGTPAAHAGNNRLCVSAPVRRAQPQRACEVGENVDDHDHPPDAEADRV